jgi:putative membrane protein
MNNNINKVSLIFKGAAMGVAEIIPGVSGGTIAFITGIYERLMDAIKAFGPDLLKVRTLDVFWKTIDGNFLIFLFGGMAIGLVSGALGISWLFEHYPLQIWGFFFGLILASSVFVLRSAGSLAIAHWFLFIVGALIAFMITRISPSEGSTSYFYIYFCGLMAITALMLPGISGSFILLLLGTYHFILQSFKGLLSSFDLAAFFTLISFGFGAITGVAFFSRLISWLLKDHRIPTLAVLAGFLLGSLNKIWPWRIPVQWLGSDGLIYSNLAGMPDGKIKVLAETNVLPNTFGSEPATFSVVLCMAIGLILVFFLERNPSATKS